MAHTRIRKFNTSDTYPEQNLDNDLCQAVVTRGGKTVWLRGQCPQNLDDAVNIDSHDPVEQTHKVMQNIHQLIEEAGGTMEHLVKVVVYITDVRHREAVYRTMGEYIKGVHPVSTGLVVQALARPEWLVEIDGTAVIPRNDMTFSLVARCADTGMFGVAISSSSPAVAARCAYARAGVGAVASQNVTDPTLGPLALDLMQGGMGAAEAIAGVTDLGRFIEYRQVLAVDRSGAHGHPFGAEQPRASGPRRRAATSPRAATCWPTTASRRRSSTAFWPVPAIWATG